MSAAGIDVLARAVSTGGAVLAHSEGACVRLPLDRWLGPPTPADQGVLDRARGPVLDIGCGPGRHVRALAKAGVLALGIELHPEVAALAQRRGTPILARSIFDGVPGAGHWQTALLLDGSIGIGGDVVALLRRVRELLRPDGELLIELDPPGTGARRALVRLEADGVLSAPFPWTLVGADAIDDVGRQAGLQVVERWSEEGRHFGRLTA